MRRSSVQQVNVTRIIVADARRLPLDHGLKTVDAMHVASAAFGRADVLLANDNRPSTLVRRTERGWYVWSGALLSGVHPARHVPGGAASGILVAPAAELPDVARGGISAREGD